MNALRRAGFTLVELLVTLTVLAVVAAVVFPVVVQQADKYSALRVARDLTHLRTALESFHLGTLNHPSYLSQLANPITSIDSSAAWHVGETYTAREVARWNGPYIDSPVLAALTVDTMVATGYAGMIKNETYCYEARYNTEILCEEADGIWLAVRIDGLIGEEFERVNDLLDGEIEPGLPGPNGSREAGRARFLGGGGIDYGLATGTFYYLAVPYER